MSVVDNHRERVDCMKISKPTDPDSESYASRIYRDLRREIISGNIKGGQRMVESSLAKNMNVSRTPIREALHQLASEGLLYSIPRVGYVVEEMSERDVVDLYDARIAIEGIAIEWATKKIARDELESMRMNLQMTGKAIAHGPTKEVVELDSEFHGIIYRATRNRTLSKICRNMGELSLRFKLALIQYPGIAQTTKDGHQLIFEAMLAGDATKAKREIKAHLKKAKEDIALLLERLHHQSI
jgi:DNA-binding GntR family transcriptional regulator